MQLSHVRTHNVEEAIKKQLSMATIAIGDGAYKCFDEYVKDCNGDIKRVWLSFYREDPSCRELNATAVAIMYMSASEAAVERSFSILGLIHTDRRLIIKLII